jgi:hypothetical protein
VNEGEDIDMTEDEVDDAENEIGKEEEKVPSPKPKEVLSKDD